MQGIERNERKLYETKGQKYTEKLQIMKRKLD